MKKISIILFFIFLIGCTSTPQPTASTPQQVSFFDGFWITPSGQTFYINNDVYIMYDKQVIANYGIFTYSDTWICLNWNKDKYTKFDYTKEEDNIFVTKADNTFVIGMWRRIKDIKEIKNINLELEYNSKNKIEGYWENRGGNKIRIFHILPNGIGFQLTCNSDLSLESRSIISYEGISPSVIYVTLDTEGMFPIKLPFNIIYERNAIKVGFGNDNSNFTKYEKK